ncbi:MAG: aminopeptidase [Deltaproteobacteria bacterium]|nr:aminopeptidase [Deltaproteobacteria bacterium]
MSSSGLVDSWRLGAARRPRGPPRDRGSSPAVPCLLLSLLLGPSAWLSGCHLSQAVVGGIDVLVSGTPLDVAMVEDPDPGVRRLLYEVTRAKRFAAVMGLKPTSSYESFVGVAGPAVVWVVAGCEPSSFNPKVWSFPVVGSFSYRAWFDRQRALEDADEIAKEGYEVWVRGASAYSTLGFFSDPVLSTMLDPGEPSGLGDLANVILHESVHATVYVGGQSPFDESLASFVADVLTERYLGASYGDGSSELQAWRVAEAARESRRGAIRAAHETLTEVFTSTASDDEKRARKTEVFDRLEVLLGRRLNNAAILQLDTYETGRGPFSELLAECRRIPALLEWVRAIEPRHFSGAHDADIGAALTRLRDEQGPCRRRGTY